MLVKPPPIPVDPPPIHIDPPPITITPDPIDVTPPPLDVTPDPITVTPPAFSVQPPAVRVGAISVDPPPLTVRPPALTIQPDPIHVQPPAFKVQPKTITFDPPPIHHDPPPFEITPPPFELDIPSPPLVGSGLLPRGMQAFDDAMRSYMEKHDFTAGVLAVMLDKRLVLSRGYGWLGPSMTEAVQPDTPMRIASVVKPITAAAIRELIRQQKLDLTTKAFDLLDVKPLPGQQADSRLKDITIEHLLRHRSGWDNEQGPLFDPMFQTPLISAATGHQPAGANDVVRFMVGQPLQFDPDSRKKYSNFGYCVLGRVIEKVSGKKYVDFVRELLRRHGVTNLALGRSLPFDRNPREPVYVSLEPPVPNVVNPAIPPGPAPDGGFHLEALDSHGGLVASAVDLVRFAAGFYVDGTRYVDRPPDDNGHDGSLPGTSSLLRWRKSGVLFAAIFNMRDAEDSSEISDALDDAAKDVTWP